MSNIENEYIEGAGGGKGKQRQPVEAPNTLRSRATIKVVEVLSEGEIVGLVGGLKGVYLDNTPVQNLDSSFNFPAVKFEERTGTLEQDYLPGFSGAESAIVVNVELVTNVVRSVSNANVDAARVTIRFPQGLSNMDAKSGDLNGHRVDIAIDARPANGTWAQVFYKTVTGKTAGAYEESYRVEKPNTATGLWEIRVRRVTPKSELTTTTDRVDWFTLTEIQDIKLTYPDAAVVGLAFDSESTGGAVPRRSYLIDGLIIKVPTNYTPTVYNPDGSVASYASYSGIWNGTFKDSWSDCPAWILYDMLTNERYGMGEFIDTSNIDIYSFYEASVYNCELIPVGDGSANLEPRFRCNAPIASREDAFKVLQSIAAMSRSMLFSGAGFLRLLQDRPSAPVAILTNANVIEGQFSYVGTALDSRITAVDISYNDINDRYLPATTTIEAEADRIAAYGFNKRELTALGVVHEGQAIRLGKWVIDTSMNSTEVVNFQVSWNNAFMEINDVVNIADNFYAAEQFGGLIKASAGTVNQITLDRPVTVTSGQTLKYMNFEGVEITRTITSTGTLSTLTLATLADSPNPSDFVGCPWVILGAVEPRQFKIMNISESSPGIYDISASQHDPTKYARVEQGVYVEPPVFTNIGGWAIGAPQNLSVTPESYTNGQGALRYRLRFNWDDVEDTLLRSYRIQHRRNNNQFVWTQDITQSEYVMEDALEGVHEYVVYAYNTRGVQSPGTSGFYDLLTDGVAASPLAAPTGLTLADDTVTFTGTSFAIKWLPPALTTAATLLNYKVEFLDGAVLKHSLDTTATNLIVTRQDIINWYGSAKRIITVRVSSRDTLNRLSSSTTNIFSNNAPAVPAFVSLTPFFNYYELTHGPIVGLDAQGTDGGILIHHSTSAGFTPDAGNLVKDDVGTSHLIEAITDTTYYVKYAAYDSWGKDGLTYSAEETVSTISAEVGVTPVAPTNLAASSVIAVTPTGAEQATITVTWDKSSNSNQYDLEIIEGITAAYYPTVGQPEAGTSVTYQFTGIPGVTYKFRVRSRAATSISVFTSQVTHVAASDNTAPAAPSSLTVSTGFNSAALKWTNPADSDLEYVQVYRRQTAPSTVAEALVATVASTAAVSITSYFDTGLANGATYSYRIRAVDRSGNFGAYSTLVSSGVVVGVPAGSVDSDSIIEDAIQSIHLAADSVDSAALADNAVNTNNILAGAVTTLALADDAITAAKIATDAITADALALNSVTGPAIASEAITAAKIAAGTITAAQINAASVRAGVLVANSITGVMIQGYTITGSNIVGQTITASEIASNAITAVKIAANSITAEKIAALSVTASKIAVADFTNHIPDANLQDTEAWSGTSGQWALTTSNSIPFRSTGRFTFVASGINYSGPITSMPYSVEGGKPYFSAFQIRNSSSGTYQALGRLFWYDSTGSACSPPFSDFTVSGSGTTINEATLKVTAPSDATTGRFSIYIQNSSTTGTVWLGGPMVRRMQGGELIVDGSISANHIVANTITANKIAANTITANEIAANTITANQIAANTITASQIAAGTITSAQINAGSIRTAILTADSITSTMIATGAVTADSVSTNQIIANTANIADGVISNAKIANATIQGAKIADAAITNAKISGTIQSDNYSAGSTGWAINKATGNAEFGSITARGNIVTGTGTAFRVDMSADDATYAIWAGTGTKTDANAVFFLKKNGQGYFGGALSAGVLRNAVTSTIVGSAAVAETGAFGTNGGSKTVTYSLSWINGFSTTTNLGGTAAGVLTATFVLERSYNGGAWTNVSTRSVTGDRNLLSFEGGVYTYRYEIGGSSTVVDTTGGSLDFNYRARITTKSGWPVADPDTPADVGNQSLTIVSTEG